jgi:hypothetical protein
MQNLLFCSDVKDMISKNNSVRADENILSEVIRMVRCFDKTKLFYKTFVVVGLEVFTTVIVQIVPFRVVIV